MIEEYRRFLYIAARAGHVVTPSDAIDEAWHLHLRHSQHYWGNFCANILKRPLHHNPATGQPGEAARLHRQYRQTLHSYRRIFGFSPPLKIWGAPIVEPHRRVFNWGFGAFAATFMALNFLTQSGVYLSVGMAIAAGILLAVTEWARPRHPANDLYKGIRVKKREYARNRNGGGGACGGCGGCGG